jgi:hypothetical protein
MCKQKVSAPLVILIYFLIFKDGILDGWQSCYYIFKRTLAELLLAIQITVVSHSDY